MVTPVEKRNNNKFCDFHNDKRHSTDECMQLKKQIKELMRAGKLSHLIKEIKQGREQSKTGKKKAATKDKPTTIYTVQSWQRIVKQKPEIKSQIVPATTSLTGFSGETIWPLGQLRLLVLVTIGDATHSTKAWMNFMVVKSLSPYNAKRLRMYFQAHPITVITDQPIKQVMSRPDVTGRLQKWSIMLGEHNIAYRPRTSVKRQILADFLIEMSGDVSQAVPAAVTQEEPWTLFTDGSSCVDGSAEYEALVVGLRIATQMGVKNVQVNVDSKLVANQVLGTYVAKENNMVKYLEIVKGLVLVEVLKNKSIKEKEVAAVIEEDGPTWMTQLVDYLKEGVLPEDKKEARKLRLKAHQYELIEGVLYRRSFLTPWLRRVRPLQADYVMREIHEGSCSMHAGPRSVVAKAIRLGYYWPKMHKDARDMIRKCRPLSGRAEEGQIFDSRHGLLHEVDRSKGSGNNYWRTDNGKQFSDNPFKDWCDKLNITQWFASVKHPQSNGLVERVNRSLGEGIKSCLGEGNKNWVEEFPHVLWAHRTMIKSSHGDTPFSLTYETEAVIPTEIGMPTYRTTTVDVVNNDEELRLNLDLLEERWERAAVYEAKAK
nr:hypothetical protein [Tanacetum cinerariifolium]